MANDINWQQQLLRILNAGVIILVIGVDQYSAQAQNDAFRLPEIPQYAAKPTVPPEYKSFFELDGHARELVDTLIGPRPGGLVPEKSYEISRPLMPATNGNAGSGVSQLEKTLEQLFTGPTESQQQQFQLPPGFSQGFSLSNSNTPIASFSESSKPVHKSIDETPNKPAFESSIKGIPNVFPDLAKPPIQLQVPEYQKVISRHMPEVPKFDEKPEVPEGGLGPIDLRRAPSSVGVAESASSGNDEDENSEYGGLPDDGASSGGGLIGSIISLIGLNAKKRKVGAPDIQSLGRTVGNLFGGNNSPFPAKNVISNVLYKALTSGSIQNNATEIAQSLANGTFGANGNLSLPISDSQKAIIEENLEMIQNLITQPSSPFCNPKPVPVSTFSIDAFMGKWYQVMNSPPFSNGPCSMVVYKKLSDVNNGGVGSIFEIFEYTTDGTPYVKPRISSGYAILKQPGELIYRTTSHKEDVIVHVINVGPLDENDEYSFVILSTNCNYPLYVFARDPVIYKQKYESLVNQILEKKGLVNGFSRLLNIVAPVDNSICTFPPSLFNIQG
uniref:Lipocalin/cytosolic fatty-acid binding domain-containing protein n=1 Tax=Syphacia muris TaxID=451379 RepID=A0A0N5ARL1_9BILA